MGSIEGSVNIWRCPNEKCPNMDPAVEAVVCPHCGSKFKPFGGFKDPFAFINAKNEAMKNKGKNISLSENDLIYFLASDYEINRGSTNGFNRKSIEK